MALQSRVTYRQETDRHFLPRAATEGMNKVLLFFSVCQSSLFVFACDYSSPRAHEEIVRSDVSLKTISRPRS